jgi:hypothetical protein
MTTASNFTHRTASARYMPGGRAPLLGDELSPGQATDGLNLLVDLALRGLVAENTTEVLDFRRDEPVVFREEANRSVLEIAFRDGDEFGRPFDLQHFNHTCIRQPQTMPKQSYR